MKDLLAREIFRVGTWNGQSFTEDDLEGIARSFRELNDIHHVPLKFGHDDDQPITSGQPAIGWISKVYVKGQKLLADFANVPNVVFDAIQSKLYRTVSVELLKNVTINGMKHANVLDAVALLGATQPAVSGLDDLAGLTMSRLSLKSVSRVCFSFDIFDDNKEDDMSGVTQADMENAIQKAMEPFQKKIDALTLENSELEKKFTKATEERDEFKKKAEGAEEAETKTKVDAARTAVAEVFEAAVKAKTITPAQREVYEKNFGVDDDEQVVKIDVADIKVVLGIKEDKKKMDDTSKSFSKDVDDDDLAPDEKVAMFTRRYMSEHDVTKYTDAQQRVLEGDPKLAREYANMNGTLGGAS